MKKKKKPDDLIAQRKREKLREQEFSAFTGKAFEQIDKSVKEKHPWKSICHKDVKTLSAEEKREVNRAIHGRIQAMRRAVWLGEEE